MLASDDRNPEFVNPRNPDAVFQVTFYQRTEPHNFNIQLNAEHRGCGDVPDCPHMKDGFGRARKFPLPEQVVEEWVHLSIPGRQDLSLHEPTTEAHKKRFPIQWERYQGAVKDSEQLVGTKLADWPEVTTHQIEFLNSQRFYTVEQVASCSDGQLQALGMSGNLLRQKARGFLTQKHENSEAAQKTKELEALKASIPQMIAEAVKQAMVQAQPPAAVPPKRGRPRKKVNDGANAAAISQPGAG